jgi:hypothetical protein
MNMEEKIKKTIKELELKKPSYEYRVPYERIQFLVKYYQSLDDDLKQEEKIINYFIDQDSLFYKRVYAITLKYFEDSDPEKNKRIALHALEKNGYVLMDIPFRIQTKEMAIKAVQQDGHCLNILDKVFKKDRNIVLEAVRKHGNALEFCEGFWDDKEVVETAVSNDGKAIEKIKNEPLFYEKDIFLKAVANNGVALQFAPPQFKEDWEIISTAYLSDPIAVNFLNEDFIENPEKIISLNFMSFYAELIDNKIKTNNFQKVCQNLLIHENQKLSLKVEQEFLDEEKWKHFFQKSQIAQVHGVNPMLELGPFLNFMLPHWQENTLNVLFKRTEKIIESSEAEMLDSRFLKQFLKSIQNEFNRRSIQGVQIQKEQTLKTLKKDNKRKIKF